jgi:signal transduction histidine kinase/CheY-like chemotaxis protein
MTTASADASSTYRHSIGLSIQLSRNAIVQALGLSMVSLMLLSATPWTVTLGWTLVAAALIIGENRLLQRLGAGPPARAWRWAPVLRVLITSLYAFAALAMMARGGPGVRLFAFALMSASVVHVLMRHYRQPGVLFACLSPYVGVVALVGVGISRDSWAAGNHLAVLAPALTVAMLAVQFWAARAQLVDSWGELMAAREAAEAREKVAEAANQAKSAFLANMSHELRTPLNGVLGMAQSLTGEPLTASQRERVAIIRRSSEALLSVLNDLLDLSKIEANAFELETVEFDLAALLTGVETAYRPLAVRKGLEFSVAVEAGAAGAYRGDSARIRRILYSLVDNAVKFTDHGAITVTASARPEGLCLQVADTGIGIGGQDLQHLFEDFFQADATRTRRHGGAGLGLAVTRELATLMGGSIKAASEPGQGATFTLLLPLERIAAAEPPPAETSAPTEAALDERPLRVLAAEDNETNQVVLKTLLGAAGIEPVVVDDGAQALAAWESQDWDIVLMDIQMPVMDGVEATRSIRRREAETGRARTPILAVTANAMTHQVSEYLAAGIDGVTPKPIRLESLLGAMETLLSPPEDSVAAAAGAA